MRLSIIIPCFNCEKTLEQAVSSCYAQGLSEDDFEIILVDDSSTDDTAHLISRLTEKHNNIISIRHETNRGGGAARNTGISRSSGDIIYCLDSDNFFGPGQPMKTMISNIKKHGLDGTAFYERRFFVGNDWKHYEPYFNRTTDKDIELSDLFAEKATLLDNFMFTKSSYLKTNGYPEHHGFDTQCFEVRYLAAHNHVRACNDTVFYHRQAMDSKSYFEREYDKGNFSKNYFLIIEDIIELFSYEAKDAVLNFDIFSRSSMKDNLMVELKRLHSKGLLFDSSFGQQNDSHVYPSYIEHYESSVKSYIIGSYEKALNEIQAAIDMGLRSKIALYHKERCLAGLRGIPTSKIDETVSKIEQFIPKKQKLYKYYHRIPIINRFIQTISKWKNIIRK